MSVSRNAVYNAAGALLPSALTLLTVPLYLELVGMERYGILTLCWVILGYSGFLDLGLGPAVTQRIAAASNRPDTDVQDIFWTSFWSSLAAGSVGAAVIYLAALFYFNSVVDTDTAFRGEVLSALPLVAAMVPMSMLGSVLGGALQARERFLGLNALGALGNTLLAVAPLLLAYLWTATLEAVIAGALLGRLIPLPLMYWLCHKAVPLGAPGRPSFAMVKNLLSFGGWMSLTSIANGFLGTFDRLAIGSTLGAAAVSAYAIPYSLVSRIILIPHSLGPALFPRFAYVDEHERRRLFLASIEAVAALVTPLSVGLIAISEPFFTLWVGASVSATATPLAYAFAAGFWIYCIGYPGFSMLQAIGRPQLVSKVLLAEVIPYLLAFLIAMWMAGLIGAAVILSIRYLLESAVLLRLGRVPVSALRLLLLPGLLILAAIAAAAGTSGPLRYLLLSALLIGATSWSFLHMPEVLRPYWRKLLDLFGSRNGDADC